ncbi:MAG: HD domain-containing protein [Proteobacteria bacterium]|nr:HD domain-containing protein [Pseudomonadota bacterium]
MNDEKYMAIPPGAIIPGSLPKFKIYVLSPNGHHILWARDGNEVSTKQLTKLADSGLKEVFIDLEEEIKYEQYLEAHLGDILENQGSSHDQKAAIFSKVSTNVVKDSFETSLGLGTMNTDALQRTQALVKNALIFIAESNSLQALAKMIGHDYKTYEHATKVLWFTVAFLRNNPDVIEQIEPDYQTFDEVQKKEILKQCGVGAMLHDIGKVFVSQEILNKNGPLTAVEWEIMKHHPLSGLAMLLDTEIPVFVKKAILHHHEDFCGGGYPMSLEGQNITILARVLRIVDVFDAMTSRRPYKEAISPVKAAQIMVGTPTEKIKMEDGSEQDDRDQGMRQCFDEQLLRKFILFLGKIASGM